MSESISCLRCRHCRLEPDTDMTRKQTMIHCGKMSARRVINLQGCPLADARLRYARSGRSAKGDRTHKASPVEIAWLRHRYAKAPWKALEAYTQRTRHALHQLAARHGLPPRPLPKDCAAAALDSRRRAGRAMTPEQSAYILQNFRDGEWPAVGVNDNRTHNNAALRASLVAGVAQRGPERSWNAIRWHAYNTYRRAPNAATHSTG